MTKREVWLKAKKGQIPNNCCLISSKLVFKKKVNSMYCARLYGSGYVQVPGLDYAKSFFLLVLEVTSCIVLILMIKYEWLGQMFNAKTVFLYGELEKEIYLKNPTGLGVVTGGNINQKIA